MNKEQQELSEPTMETELSAIKRYFDARDENGDLYLASSNYEMGGKDERGADWVLASDYDALLALHKESESQLCELREIVKDLAICSNYDPNRGRSSPGKWVTANIPNVLWVRITKAADLLLEKAEATK